METTTLTLQLTQQELDALRYALEEGLSNAQSDNNHELENSIGKTALDGRSKLFYGCGTKRPPKLNKNMKP